MDRSNASQMDTPVKIITLGSALIILLFDQLTKYLVRCSFMVGESKTLIPHLLSLTYVRNTGAVWGVFQQENELLILISLFVLAVIVFFYKHLTAGRRVYSSIIGMMAGGITGNLIDRVRFGWVTDFIDCYINQSHWPAFNIADAAICTGVCVYLLFFFRPVMHKSKDSPRG
jgi:signal peptidase II